MSKKAIILLSGGLDSTTVLAIAKSQGYECYCISFDYGQKHALELEYAKQIANVYQVAEHKIAKIDLSIFGRSSLIDDTPVPKHKDLSHLTTGTVPSTYVPARNTIFISYAFGYAEVIGATEIFIGCNALDYSNYPDCKPEYIEKFSALLSVAQSKPESEIKIVAPLLHMTKSQIIISGMQLGINYALTTSCYSPDDHGLACGECDACLLRKGGFAGAGLTDPIRYSQK